MFRSRPITDHELNKDDILELYYITPIGNLESILQKGILSNRRAAKSNPKHNDISDGEVQDIRAGKKIRRADPAKPEMSLHKFVPLYLNPHNAMMYMRKSQHAELCILRIRREILNRGDVILSNQNAATYPARFFPSSEFRLSPQSTKFLTSPVSTRFFSDNPVEQQDKQGKLKQVRQAEVLVPYQIDPSYIADIFVSGPEAEITVSAVLQNLQSTLNIRINQSMFFQGIEPFISLSEYTPLESLTDEAKRELNTNLPNSSPEPSDHEEKDSEPGDEETEKPSKRSKT